MPLFPFLAGLRWRLRTPEVAVLDSASPYPDQSEVQLVGQTLLQKECEVSIRDGRCCRRKCRYPGNHPRSSYSPGQTWKAYFAGFD